MRPSSATALPATTRPSVDEQWRTKTQALLYSMLGLAGDPAVSRVFGARFMVPSFMALRGSLNAKVAQISKTKQGEYQGRFHQSPSAGPPLPSPATLGIDQKTPQSNLFVWRATALTIL